jgi:predicted NBD/HSP70 family sugar kinase
MSLQILCFDIGGTEVKYGLVDALGEVHEAGRMPTQANEGGKALLQRLVEHARPHVEQIAGISISTFGAIEPQQGAITGLADAVPGYAGMPLGRLLHEAFDLPVCVENDVNCVALAEHWRGVAKGVDSFVALTIGTGIGGGVVVGGQLLRGANFSAGEWGYMLVDGQVWEEIASTRALVNMARARMGDAHLDGRLIFDRLEAGDAAIRAIFDDWLAPLATGIVNLVYVLNPQLVVIGGGVAERGDVLLVPLTQRIGAIIHPDLQAKVRLAAAGAGNHAGLIGAARNWFNRHRANAVVA